MDVGREIIDLLLGKVRIQSHASAAVDGMVNGCLKSGRRTQAFLESFKLVDREF